jgi:hypothetical protein
MPTGQGVLLTRIEASLAGDAASVALTIHRITSSRQSVEEIEEFDSSGLTVRRGNQVIHSERSSTFARLLGRSLTLPFDRFSAELNLFQGLHLNPRYLLETQWLDLVLLAIPALPPSEQVPHRAWPGQRVIGTQEEASRFDFITLRNQLVSMDDGIAIVEIRGKGHHHGYVILPCEISGTARFSIADGQWIETVLIERHLPDEPPTVIRARVLPEGAPP